MSIWTGSTKRGMETGRISEDQFVAQDAQRTKRSQDHYHTKQARDARDAQWQRMKQRNPGMLIPRSWFHKGEQG